MADVDADGVCDDVDDCVGEYDECGVQWAELSLIAVATSYLLDNVSVKATKLTRLVCVAVRA